MLVRMNEIESNKGNRLFGDINLSDEEVVKLLILNKHEIDFEYGERINKIYELESNSKELNQELINTYIYLDELITLCDFKDYQKNILNYLFEGNSFMDVSIITKNTTSQNIKKKFKSICKSIAEMNNRQWKIFIHKTKLNTEFKDCNACKKSLPLTNGFFGKRGKSFSGICKVCDSKRKSKS